MRVHSILPVLAATVLLAACGGGGGGGGSSVPPPTDSGGLSNASVQRNDSQSALAGVEGYESFASGGENALAVGPTIHRLVAKIDVRALAEHRDQSSTCEAESSGGGIEETIIDTSETQATFTIETFYDDACTEPESELVWTATESSSASGYTVSGPATFSEYAQGSTTPTESANAAITFDENADYDLTGISILLTSVTSGGTQIGSIGIACALDASTAESTACGVATVNGSSDYGAVVSAALSSGSSITMQLSQYAGSSLAIAAGTIPNWTITPASALTQSVSLTGSSTSSGYTITLTDSQNDGTYTIEGSAATGEVTGTLVETGTTTTYASFTVNGSGNGTVTYANGSTASIVDYIIQS